MEKSDGKNAYWCVVSGSDLWLVDGQIPYGSAEQWDLPQEKAILVDRYQNSPVYWLNAADIEQDRPLTSLRELLGVDEALFLAASKAVQYGHMSQTIRFCPQCGGVTISIISNWQCSATIAEPCTIRVFFPALLLPYVNSSKFCWRSTHAIAMVCTP